MISLLVPTRGRPGRFKHMRQSALDTASGPIEFISYYDDDDPTFEDYPTADHRIVGPRIVLSEAWNATAKHATGDLLMLAADDLVFRTPGWDVKVRAAAETYPDGIVLVHVDDGFQGESLATHPIVTRRWVHVVGTFCPPYFTADYNDTWLQDVADRIGRRVWVPEVLVEHLHPVAGKAMWDETYHAQRARKVSDRMPREYRYREAEREEWAEKLRAAMRP